MELSQISYFLHLARTLNFTRAATACHITQPALTRAIQRMEAEFGGKLILRERQHTQLTPLGRIMLPLLEHVHEAADRAGREASAFRTRNMAPLRLGLERCIDSTLVMPLLAELGRQLPGVELALRAGSAEDLALWLLATDIDVGVTAQPSRLPERAHRWQLFADPVVLLLPAEADVEQVLRVRPLIAWPDPPMEIERARAALAARLTDTSTTIHRISSHEQLLDMIRDGYGWALSLQHARCAGGVVQRAVEPALTVPIHLAAMAGRPRHRAAEMFLKIACARRWGGAAAEAAA